MNSGQNPKLDLSIVIPSAGKPERLLSCLNAISAQSVDSPAFEVIVGVSKSCPDEIKNLILNSGIARIRIECCGDGSVNALRNCAARHATGEWILFLDDDCLLSSANSIIDRVARHKSARNRKTVFCGGYASELELGIFGKSYNLIASHWAIAKNLNGHFRFLAGNFSIFREAFQASGFDESLTDGGEEVELASRLIQRGARIEFVKALDVVHRSDHNCRSFFRRAWEHGEAPRPRDAMLPHSKAAVFSGIHLFRACASEPIIAVVSSLYLLTTNVSRMSARIRRTFRLTELR